MHDKFKKNSENLKGYNSELLLNILRKTSIETKIRHNNELFVDENWKINSKIINNKISSENSNLKRILSEIFQIKKY